VDDQSKKTKEKQEGWPIKTMGAEGEVESEHFLNTRILFGEIDHSFLLQQNSRQTVLMW
jgi:hypothetical protein